MTEPSPIKFRGESSITVDDKGRFAMPASHRETVSAHCRNRLVITYNPFEHGCLWIYPEHVWDEVFERIDPLPQVRAVHRNLQMKLIGAASHVEPDSNGRVSLPASQRSATGIEKKAVLLGMGNKFELWSEQAHLAKIRQTISEDEITEGMFDLKL